MKLYRFMSAEEAGKLVLGKVLENYTDHSVKRGTASTSKGFCFGIGDKEQACKDFRHLKGIVDFKVLEFECKTFDDYPAFDKPHKMFDEYCTEDYSLNDFKEYHVYAVFFDMLKDPSGTDCLMLRDLGIENSSEVLTDDVDLNNGLSVSREIIKLLHKHKDIRAGQAMIALAVATSFIFDVIVENEGIALQRCFDDFVDLLKRVTFSDKEK